MASLAELSPSALRALQEDVAQQARAASSLESAAHAMLARVLRELGDTVVLARVYLAVKQSALPAAELEFARAVAAEEREPTLSAATPVLTLMASRGALPAWNARANSKRHRALPMTRGVLEARIPLVISLLEQTGDAPTAAQAEGVWEGDLSAEIKPGMAALLHLPEARTATDAKGRALVLSREFVEHYKVRSVVGSAGQYLGGGFVALVLYLREAVERPVAQRMVPLLGTFRAATTTKQLKGLYFDANPQG